MQGHTNLARPQAQNSKTFIPRLFVDRCRQQARERIRHWDGLRPVERVVLEKIADRIFCDTLDGWMAAVSQVGLASEAHVSRSTIARTTKELERRRFIRKLAPQRDGDTCRYLLFAKPSPLPYVAPAPRKKNRTGSGNLTHDQENSSSPVSVSPVPISPDPVPIPVPEVLKKEPEERDTRAREVPIQKKAFGENGNVRLTEADHQDIQTRMAPGIANLYIQTLDYQIKAKRRVYPDHHATLLLWFTQDQRKNLGGNGNGKFSSRLDEQKAEFYRRMDVQDRERAGRL